MTVIFQQVLQMEPWRKNRISFAAKVFAVKNMTARVEKYYFFQKNNSNIRILLSQLKWICMQEKKIRESLKMTDYWQSMLSVWKKSRRLI